MITLYNINKIKSGGLRILFVAFILNLYIGLFSGVYYFLSNAFLSKGVVINGAVLDMKDDFYYIQSNLYVIFLFVLTYSVIESFNLNRIEKMTFWYFMFGVAFFVFFYLFLSFLTSYMFISIGPYYNIKSVDLFYKCSLIALSIFTTYLLFKPKKKK